MRTLLIINDPPYGTERAYNGLRLASALAGRDDQEVRVFLVGDAVSCAKSGQTLPRGYYSLERMLTGVRVRGGETGVCGTCMDARGLRDDELVEGSRRRTLDELTDWTLQADKVLVF